MRDHPDVVMTFMEDPQDDGVILYHFLLDPKVLSAGGRRGVRDAETAMEAWCTATFGPGVARDQPKGWSKSPWSCFSFDDVYQATQFKLRWM